MKTNKKYIDVVCFNDKTGYIKPLYFIWKNNKKVPILKIKDICPSATVKVGSYGLRYTCVLGQNKIRHLFYDRGKWFVEVDDSFL